MKWMRWIGLALMGVVLAAPQASAQSGGWDVAVYPVLAWIPLGIDMKVDVPPSDSGSGGSGDIIDGRFDGACLGGFSAAKDRIRIDADAMWAGVGGDRKERPVLSVDADVIYGHGSVGYMVAKDLYVTAGIRRMALKYEIKFGDQLNFERKPGVTVPLVGLAWHRKGDRLDVHAVFEGGGFGVGSDVEMFGGVRFDFRPMTHFGLTGGYNLLYFKVTNEVAKRTFKIEQSLHGPVLGIGFYF